MNRCLRRRSSAFTLIEMLVVIAITAVLLTIIVFPVFQSFNLTRAAQIFATAQNDARALTERISREIDSAVSVRGSTATVATTLNQNNVNLPASTLVIQIPGHLNTSTNTRPAVEVALPWSKLDISPAAQTGAYVTNKNGTQLGFQGPGNGKADPTLKTLTGQVQTPVVPSTLMVRYSLALRDPTLPYNEPYSGILMAQSGGRDNLIALRRSVVATYVPGSNGTAVGNSALFALDSQGNPILDDPRFLVLDRQALSTDVDAPTGAIMQDSHNLRVYHWLGLSPSWENSVDSNVSVEHQVSNFAHTVLETQISRFDMIFPQYDLRTRVPAYDTVAVGGGTKVGVPRITPLVQFKPTVVSSDPAAGQEALRPNEESDNAIAIAPDVYKTEYGLWNQAVVRVFPEGFNSSNTANNSYSIGYPANVGNTSNASSIPGFSIFAYNPNASGAGEFSTGIEYFDTYTYDHDVALLAGSSTPVYPFTQAALAANGRSGWLTNSTATALFTPFHYLSGTGKIICSFDISEVGTTTLPNDPNQDPNRPNLPTEYISNTPQSPETDTNGGQGTNYPWSPINGTSSNPYDINSCFNQFWNTHPNLVPNIQRFIDLRVTANEDGTLPPMYPTTVNGGITNFQSLQPDGSMLNRVRIVPGTDVVTGPDQAPGDHYGHPIRYTRVTGTPGVNQYRINYVDQREPSVANGTGSEVTPAAYQTAFNLSNNDLNGFSVDTYNPSNVVSAVLQARYKVGYIQLNSNPAQPLPQGYSNGENMVPVPFKVDYRFQFTGTLPSANVPAGGGLTDTFAVDYDTRQLMQVLLTLRSLPQSNLPNPQTVTLKATASLQNVAR